jgi:hypothetical protein
MTRFRRREGDRASLNYDGFYKDSILKHLQHFKRRLHGFDVANVLGLMIAALGLPVMFLLLWFLRARGRSGELNNT